MAWRIDAAQQILQEYVPKGDDDRTALFIKALVQYAPTERGQRNICNSILECPLKVTPEQSLSAVLYELREHFLMGLIYPIKAKGGRTPRVTEHPSRKESIEEETMLNELYLSSAKRDRNKLKKLVLLRDNYRSVISGLADLSSARAGKVPQNVEVVPTEAAHILPFSLATNQPERAEVWAAISSFSGMDLSVVLGGNDINRLGNVFTLSVIEHTNFGQLEFWLEKVQGKDHTYVLNSALALGGIPRGSEVTFVDHGLGLEMPDPELITIHAACAQVVHQSGMAEYIDHILQDLEEIPVLAEDGSSNALMIALCSISVR